jgi:hypothetical protein
MGDADHVRVRNLTIKHETESALLVEAEDGGEHWLPFSQTSRITRAKVKGGDEVWIPRWLAQKRELSYD